MIVYFTGTGNSRYCAAMLAERLGDELMDSFHFIRDGIAAELTSQRPWVFVSPTHGWQIPRIFAAFIRSGYFSGSRDAYFVMSCGSEIGNAMAANRALCAEKGFRYRGTLQVVMPENYIAMFDAPGGEEASRIIAAARPALEKGAELIGQGRELPVPGAGAVDRLKSGVVNRFFYRFLVKDRAFRVTDACIGCGKCARGCPTNNISLRDGRPLWGGGCVHCMACVCGCPAEAIEYGQKSVGQPRYLCPEYENVKGEK